MLLILAKKVALNEHPGFPHPAKPAYAGCRLLYLGAPVKAILNRRKP